jgi:hypothetical protein
LIWLLVLGLLVLVLILALVFHKRIAALEQQTATSVSQSQWMSSAVAIRNDFNALASRVSTAEQKLVSKL